MIIVLIEDVAAIVSMTRVVLVGFDHKLQRLVTNASHNMGKRKGLKGRLGRRMLGTKYALITQ